ncbi:MAG: SDR family oxidoreductase [Bdellovibrionales bacterium]|nr:SDR family oxidoreductase [Bdellovibrionales bacterium]
MKSLKNKTIFVTGGSRGIGLAIAQRAAKEGANIVIAAKTVERHPKLDGTIFTAAESITSQGGKALPVECDIRDELAIKKAVQKAADHFGGIDILLLNASAIFLTPTEKTEFKRWNLMHEVILRGSFFAVQNCLPYLKKSEEAHILALCPPLNTQPKWLAPYLAYSLAKFGLSLSITGWAEEFKNQISVNGLWPKTLIATAAVQNLLGGDTMIQKSRKPEIVAEAAHWILTGKSESGKLYLDEDIISKELKLDPQIFAVNPKEEPALDIYVN